MNEMTEEEKKECRDMTDFKACDGDCDKCELSYDYVTGYNDGYTDGYADAY